MLQNDWTELYYVCIRCSCIYSHLHYLQILLQAQLKPATAARLKEAVPQISEKDLQEMMKVPFMRSFDPTIMQEPFVYRMVELMQHYGSG